MARMDRICRPSIDQDPLAGCVRVAGTCTSRFGEEDAGCPRRRKGAGIMVLAAVRHCPPRLVVQIAPSMGRTIDRSIEQSELSSAGLRVVGRLLRLGCCGGRRAGAPTTLAPFGRSLESKCLGLPLLRQPPPRPPPTHDNPPLHPHAHGQRGAEAAAVTAEKGFGVLRAVREAAASSGRRRPLHNCRGCCWDTGRLRLDRRPLRRAAPRRHVHARVL